MNPYETLGVDTSSSEDDIKKAYRKLSKKYHPDANGGDDAEFKKISEAYRILTDPKAKADYQREQMRKAQSGNPFGGFTRSSSMDDIMREFMNGGTPFGFGPDVHFHRSKVKKKVHGKDINIRVMLSLEESFRGKSIEIKVDRNERLNSEKLVKRNKRIKVVIPKGASDGQILLLRKQGNQGMNGGKDGNIVITVNVDPHRYFMRREHDLYATVKVPVSQMILGGQFQFKNIDGEMLTVNVPARSREDDEVEFLDKGMPVGNSDTRGRLKLILTPSMPKNMTDAQLQALQGIGLETKNNLVPESMI